MLAVRAVQRNVTDQMTAVGSSLIPGAITRALEVALIIAPFVPSVDLVFADLTLAAGDGLDPLSISVGDGPDAGFDPTTGEGILTVPDPVGGWNWVLTADQTPPVVVYGYALYENGGVPAPLKATALLPAPVSLTIIGDQIGIGTVELRLPAQPLS